MWYKTVVYYKLFVNGKKGAYLFLCRMGVCFEITIALEIEAMKVTNQKVICNQ